MENPEFLIQKNKTLLKFEGLLSNISSLIYKELEKEKLDPQLINMRSRECPYEVTLENKLGVIGTAYIRNKRNHFFSIDYGEKKVNGYNAYIEFKRILQENRKICFSYQDRPHPVSNEYSTTGSSMLEKNEQAPGEIKALEEIVKQLSSDDLSFELTLVERGE